jgi:hypothetical protein
MCNFDQLGGDQGRFPDHVVTITPDLVKRLDFERIECPKCGEKFGD